MQYEARLAIATGASENNQAIKRGLLRDLAGKFQGRIICIHMHRLVLVPDQRVSVWKSPGACLELQQELLRIS